LAGEAGDDVYLFDTDTPLDTDTVSEALNAGRDTFDFSATSSQAVSVNLADPALQIVNANLSLDLNAGNRIENVIGGERGDTLTGNSLDNVLTGGAGNDRYLFDTDLLLGSDRIVEASAAIGGNDTLDFSATTTQSVALNLTSAAPQEVTVSAVTVRLTLTLSASGAVENVLGGARNDAFSVTPSETTAFSFDGGAGAADALDFDAQGLAVAQTPNSLTATGRQPVTFANIEQVNVQNPALVALALAGAPPLSNELGLTDYETAAGQDLAARWGIAQRLLIGQSDGIAWLTDDAARVLTIDLIGQSDGMGWLTARDADTTGGPRSDDPQFWLKAKKLRAAGRLVVLRQ